jgi:hypothetical protein
LGKSKLRVHIFALGSLGFFPAALNRRSVHRIALGRNIPALFSVTFLTAEGSIKLSK